MIITRTPYRISFFGGGTDYPAWYEKNGGAVLSTSIDKYCHITARSLPPFFEKRHHIVYSRIENIDHLDEIEHPSVRECLRFSGIDHGVSIIHDGDLPARSGVGSSSAFTVGLLHALYALRGKMVSRYQLAKDAIHVEQECIKENVGSQDQSAAAFGGLNRITFGGSEKIRVEPIVMNKIRLNDFQDHLMLFFTGTSRNASEVAADWIKNAGRNENDLRKMHKMVDEAVNILTDATADLREFGKLLDDGWKLKRGLTENVSNSVVDQAYDSAKKAGAIGGKLLGAGGGGFMMFFVDPDKKEAVKRNLQGYMHVPFRFENLGSHVVHYSQNIEVAGTGVV